MERKLWKFLDRFGWLIAVVFFGYSILAFIGDFTGESIPNIVRNPILRLITLLISFIILGWKAWQYRQRHLDVIEKRPNIIATGFYKEDVPTTTKILKTRKPKKGKRASGGISISGIPSLEQSSSGGTILAITDFAQISEPQLEKKFKPGDNYDRFYLEFRNVKHDKINIEDAEDVHAQLTFYNREGNQLYSHEMPRWRNTLPPHKFDGEIAIKASEKPEQLCLVIRKQGSEELFIFCDDSYIDGSFEPMQNIFKLKGDEHFIHVHLNAKNMESKTFWLSVINRGKNEDPDFDFIDPPLK